MSRNTNRTVRHTLIIVGTLISFVTQAQQVDFYAGAGYATYAQHDLKQLQTDYATNWPVQFNVLAKFPPWYTYHAGFNLTYTRFFLGLEFGHGSTGGRSYYEDYSGRASRDLLLTYDSYSLTGGAFIFNKKNFSLGAGGKFSFVPTVVGSRMSLAFGGDRAAITTYCYAKNFGVQPFILARQYFGSLFIQANVGYEYQPDAELRTPNDVDFQRISYRAISSNGSGFRFSLSGGVSIGRKKDDPQ